MPIDLVASRAEAWIETDNREAPPRAIRVASRAEAWIETLPSKLAAATSAVAYRAEAWIETGSTPQM